MHDDGLSGTCVRDSSISLSDLCAGEATSYSKTSGFVCLCKWLTNHYCGRVLPSAQLSQDCRRWVYQWGGVRFGPRGHTLLFLHQDRSAAESFGRRVYHFFHHRLGDCVWTGGGDCGAGIVRLLPPCVLQCGLQLLWSHCPIVS